MRNLVNRFKESADWLISEAVDTVPVVGLSALIIYVGTVSINRVTTDEGRGERVTDCSEGYVGAVEVTDVELSETGTRVVLTQSGVEALNSANVVTLQYLTGSLALSSS